MALKIQNLLQTKNNSRLRFICCCLLLLPLLAVINTSAEPLYKCRGINGEDVFTNQKTDDNCQIYLQAFQQSEPAKSEDILLRELLNQPDFMKLSPPVSNGLGLTLLHGTGLNRFYEKLYRLQRGEIQRLSVFHLGDSHVRSEAFPARLAGLFQNKFGGADGELCYPSEKNGKSSKKRISKKPAKKVSSKKARKFVMPPNAAYNKMSMELSGGKLPMRVQKNATAPDKVDDINVEKKATQTEVRTTPTDLCKPAANLTNFGGRGISYNSYGNSGKTFAWYAAYPDLVRQLQQYNPDLIIITLGTNDAFAKLEYQSAWKSVDSFVSVIRSISPNSSLLFTTPPDSYFRNGQHNQYIAVMQKVIIDYATANGHAAWDFTTAMGGAGSMDNWLRADLARPDRIHLSSKGSKLKADMLFNDIFNGFSRYLQSTSR